MRHGSETSAPALIGRNIAIASKKVLWADPDQANPRTNATTPAVAAISIRFSHMVSGFERLEGIMRTVYNQYDSMVRPLKEVAR